MSPVRCACFLLQGSLSTRRQYLLHDADAIVHCSDHGEQRGRSVRRHRGQAAARHAGPLRSAPGAPPRPGRIRSSTLRRRGPRRVNQTRIHSKRTVQTTCAITPQLCDLVCSRIAFGSMIPRNVFRFFSEKINVFEIVNENKFEVVIL